MNDTPQTDAAIQRSCIDDLQCEWVEVGFARQLEHDLNVANNWNRNLQNLCVDLVKGNSRLQIELDASCNSEELRQVRAENAALREQAEFGAGVLMEAAKYKAENVELREELNESQRVVIETRLASVSGMNEIRSALGLPLGHEDKTGKRVLDYVVDLKRENTRLLEGILNAAKMVCEELDRRAAAQKEAKP